jgi:hypothetical protein
MEFLTYETLPSPASNPGRPPTKYPLARLALKEGFRIPAAEADPIQKVKAYIATRNCMLKPKRFGCFQNIDGSIEVYRIS